MKSCFDTKRLSLLGLTTFDFTSSGKLELDFDHSEQDFVLIVTKEPKKAAGYFGFVENRDGARKKIIRAFSESDVIFRNSS